MVNCFGDLPSGSSLFKSIHVTTATTSPRTQRIATGYLILATVFWGCSFTWAKTLGDFSNARLGLPVNSAAGPIYVLAFRFTLAAVAWFAIFPQSRRGWTLKSLAGGAFLGLLQAVGMFLQMLGLNLTTPAVSAFLTALTVLFVPIIVAVWSLRLPPWGIWVSVALATVGIWMLTGASPTGFGRGELLGLACSLVFSFYLIGVNAIVPRDNPFRITGVSVLVTGLSAFAVLPFVLHRGGTMNWSIPLAFDAWSRLLLLVFLPTVASFGILTFYQPKITATRASLLYLFEPIFAAVYDYAEKRTTLSAVATAGAALIIVANVFVELAGQLKSKD